MPLGYAASPSRQRSVFDDSQFLELLLNIREVHVLIRWADEAHLFEVLQLVTRRKNEQSPVRDVMLKSLSKIPAGRWKDSHLQDLELVIRQALDASDLSSSSIGYIQYLLAGIIAFHPRWAACEMALIVQERGLVTMTEVVRGAGQTSVKEIMDILNIELSPLFQILLEKKDALPLATLAQRFSWVDGGKPLREWTGLLDALQNLLEMYDSKHSEAFAHSAHIIIKILKENRPMTWWRKIPEWVEKRSYLIGLPGVFKHVHTHLQNLLLPYLYREIEFWPNNSTPLDDLRSGFEKWTHSQQEQFATRLVEDIENEETTSDKKQIYIKQLGLLQFVDPYHLISLASSDTPPIRDAAVRALGRLDNDQGVPTLIEALGDNRARIAIYALRNKFLSMSKPEAMRILQFVPMTRVTVAKEVVRLIGDLETEEAFQCLLEIERTESGKSAKSIVQAESSERTDADEKSGSNEETALNERKGLHVDVRIALFRSMRPYLDREEAWQLFTNAAQDHDPDTAKAVLDIPQDYMASNTRIRYFQVLLVLLEHTSMEVRIEALRKCHDLRLQDPDYTFVPRLLALLESHSKVEAELAAGAIFKTYAKSHPELIGDVFREALPKRRYLHILHRAYLEHVSSSETRNSDAVTHSVLCILKIDRLSHSLQLKLMFNGLPLSEIRSLLMEVIPELHADNLALAESLIRNFVQDWDVAATEGFELELAANEDERARRLALEMLISSVKSDGSWTDKRRTRLEEYRKDGSVLVAEAAWEVDLPENQT